MVQRFTKLPLQQRISFNMQSNMSNCCQIRMTVVCFSEILTRPHMANG